MPYTDEEKRERKNAYQREYYQKHREKINEHNKKYSAGYYQQNKEKIDKQIKQYSLEHKEEIREYQKRWYQEHKELVKARTKKWAKEHAEEIGKRHKKRHDERRDFLCDYKLKKGCADCGVKGPAAILDFHHIHPSKKDMTVSSMIDLSSDRIITEIEKCIVLCSNCHRIRHWEERKENNEKH